MKEGYIEKSKRKNILIITDDMRASSGVAHIAREIVINTSHKYNWVQLAGSLNHPDKGKVIDLSESISEKIGIKDAYVKIIPVDNYGNVDIIETLIKEEKIDSLFLITDPRYFEWLFHSENQIRRKIPIIYLNIWDDMPVPLYNTEFYESCDALFSISKQTKLINTLCLEHSGISYMDVDLGEVNFFKNSQRPTPIILKYIPHGVDENIFKPLEEADELLLSMRKDMNIENKEFILFFNSKNIRRKSLPDAIAAWKLFIDSLPKEKQDKCLFVLHTQPVDQNGTDVMEVINYLFGEENETIKISPHNLTQEQLNVLYNMADGVILPSSAEGWGLSLTESLLSGTPIIANTVGGMQDQMRFEDEEGKWYTNNVKVPSNHQKTYTKHGAWALPVYPSALSLVGSPQTPYIFDSRCSIEDLKDRITELYNMSPDERKARGLLGREWAIGEEAGFTSKKMNERVIEGMERLFEVWKPREKFEFYRDDEYIPKTINHKLIYE